MSTHVSVPLYRGHAIKPLSSPVWGAFSGNKPWRWLVFPNASRWGASWYAHSPADARKVIDMIAEGKIDNETVRLTRVPIRDHPEVEEVAA